MSLLAKRLDYPLSYSDCDVVIEIMEVTTKIHSDPDHVICTSTVHLEVLIIGEL